MHPDWERSAAGRAFYKLFFLTGLHVNATSEHRDEEERYHLRSKTREIQQSSLTEAKQRAMARTVARHRVYNLPYLSAERCWGPFLPIGYSPPPPDDELDSHTSGSETDKGKAREISVEDPQATPAEEPPRWPRQKGRGRSAESSLAQVDMSSVRAILTNFDEHDLQFMDEDEDVDPDYVPTHYLTESDTEIHSSDDENDTEQDHIVGSFFFTDQDAEDGEDPVISARGSFPVFPQRPDLVYPDWAFLSAARLVITENLRERYGNDIPMWPWFTTVAAVQATREILLRMGVSLPQNLKTDRTAEEIDGDEDVDDEEDIDRAKTSNDTPHESRSPIEALRMGSAPGFWAGRGTKEGWTGIASDEQERELSKPWKIDKDVEFVDGWDWAGAEGRWMRAVCWMDYRDLLFHNLQTNYPTIGYRHEIEETCRVFPMTLRVVGFSRVSPPLALPPSSSSPKPSSKSPPSSKAKGKGKATDHGYADSSYDPLVYALPIIHIVGEFRGSDVDESVARRARGTIRMIGDRAIRWNLISSEVSTPDRDEWVMEGVQVGEIGSAMGVVGMWTGAQHERGDPIGPSWAWKME
ncbi:hypothetical protein C8R42DRAFT_678786 [Lentinula raphanica]|nr:hypothetical protein C8R42DRAFT_678786 [Lentinula raphanica]